MNDTFLAGARALLGERHVLTGEALRPYARDVGGFVRDLPAVLQPGSREEVRALLALAVRCSMPLAPISQGRNWGLGSRLPVRSGTAVLSLARLDKIVKVDEELGYAVIEPGVTQGQLSRYLAERRSAFIIDVTGSGAGSSVVGNSLERGVAYNTLRVDTLTAVEAILADGTTVRTGFSHYPQPTAGAVFRSGIGPDLQGLFVQSNLAVVVEATVRLLPRPKSSLSFTVAAAEADVPQLLEELRGLVAERILLGVPHVFNRHRLVPGLAPLMLIQAQRIGLRLGREEIEGYLGKMLKGDWWAFGGISGHPAMVRAAKRLVRKRLSAKYGVRFMSDRTADLMLRVARLLGRKKLQAMLEATRCMRGISRGEPTDDSLYSVLWPATTALSEHDHLEPDAGPGGYLFVVPIVPLRAVDAGRVIEAMKGVGKAHGFTVAMSLNTPSYQFIEGVISIDFPRGDPARVLAAHACVREMNQQLIALGCYPYRIDIDNHDLMVDPNDPFWRTVRRLKDALDPAGILAPGKFCPEPSEVAQSPRLVSG